MNNIKDCEICELIDDVNPVVKTKHWLGYVKPNQAYLGQCDFFLKRHVGDLALISNEELIDFKNLVKAVETAMKSAFSASMFNWTCLMNNAYQDNPPHPHVHWHLKPRYDQPVEFNGIEFTDDEYGYHYDESKDFVADAATIQQIHNAISEDLHQYFPLRIFNKTKRAKI